MIPETPCLFGSLSNASEAILRWLDIAGIAGDLVLMRHPELAPAYKAFFRLILLRLTVFIPIYI